MIIQRKTPKNSNIIIIQTIHSDIKTEIYYNYFIHIKTFLRRRHPKKMTIEIHLPPPYPTIPYFFGIVNI